MKYSEIKTMDQLEEAERLIKGRIERKGTAVQNSFYSAKESYSPGNLLMSGLKSFSSYIPIDQLLLTTVRRVKRKLLK